MNNTYIQKLEDIGLRITDPNLTSNDHQNITCLLCNTIFKATPKSKLQNYKKSGLKGCPHCTRKQQYSAVNDTNEQRLLDMGYILLGPYKGLHKPILLKNPKCECGGTPWKTQPERIFTGNSFCAPCNIENKRRRLHSFNEERHNNSVCTKSGYGQYRQIVYKLTRNSYRKYKHIINPSNLKRALAGTPGYHLDHIISVKYCFQNNIPTDICADYRNLTMTEWRANITKNQKSNVRFPDIFYPYVKSMYKLDDFITSIQNNVPIAFDAYVDFNPYSITLFNKQLQFGVMFITLNEYRQQTVRTVYYFKNMKKYFEERNIKVLFIFEDEWNTNSELIIKKIKHYFGINDVPKIFARKCTIKEVTRDEKRIFLINNHIQGSTGSKINLGAYYNNELVALMTFANPRVLMNKNIVGQKDKWELVRFATNNGYHVVGIAGKLLSYFEKTYSWSMIYSFADRRWSEGNLYTKLGFQLDRVNKPEYFYLENGVRKHRYNYRKDILKHKFKETYDPTLTEYQNMLKHGYDRIWDCGTLKFIKTNTSPVPKSNP
ncbi:MAG: hypothetical protein JWP44_5029 [Mucilaginibacter sp.]|nr:hypothetical protein [Mucilaginibacter sp.]